MQLRPSQRYVPLTFSWKSMVAVWTAWGKSWLWVHIYLWCCPGCDVTHITLESNVLLGAPFPCTTSSSAPQSHLLLHSFHLTFETSSQVRFPSVFSIKRTANLTVTPCMSQSYTTTNLPSHSAWYQRWPGDLSSPTALLALRLGSHPLRMLWTVKPLYSPFTLPISHLKCSR